ncbi:uncharacterized protein CTRU02_215631 [Colletotrichum truncatum]|uniref:Uncharacterized protein n=1 Tax=Colletotrichum truncatum TaxID=5467 RepID=A0ACC3YCD3_COLTU|nr:uncharacterized protein CTRU02_05427 [Colletotrichum truncatum]KAF6793871.1 hypothetical protein CTRU02_05427 [Colletotrichum truncatum]
MFRVLSLLTGPGANDQHNMSANQPALKGTGEQHGISIVLCPSSSFPHTFHLFDTSSLPFSFCSTSAVAITMPSDKDRLYVALYARGGQPKMPGLEDTYHWAFLVGPKHESANSRGRRIHAKETMTLAGEPPMPQMQWEYESKKVTMAPTSAILVRVVIAKIEDKDRLKSIFEEISLESEDFNCVKFVKDGWRAAQKDNKALGTSAKGWKAIRDTAMWYVEKKRAEHRFDGTGTYDPTKVPTWDMLEDKELIP